MTFAIAALVFAIDRIAKWAITSYLGPGDTFQVIPGLLHLTLIQNTGAAFGIFRGWSALFISVSLAAIAGITFYVFGNKNIEKPVRIALGLVLGGAAGNLTDRLLFGHVIDFFDFRVWPVFNVADSCITAGIAVILIHSLCIRYFLK